MHDVEGCCVADTYQKLVILEVSGSFNKVGAEKARCRKEKEATINVDSDGEKKHDKSTVLDCVRKVIDVGETVNKTEILLGQGSESSDLISYTNLGLGSPQRDKRHEKTKTSL